MAVQFVMVLIMTMTPLHMDDHGHGFFGAVGFVISAHTLGMFALAPISGRLTDRFGCIKVIYAGCAVLAASGVLSALAPPSSEVVLAGALFLLGCGWNLGFVAGSAMLTGGVSLTERTRLQGLDDALIWSTAAIASLGSGVLAATAGFAALGVLGSALVIVPVFLIAWSRRTIDDHPGQRLVRARRGLAGRARGRSSVSIQAASTRAHSSTTSSSGTRSSAECAWRSSPGPKITVGVAPSLTSSRMSAPYGLPIKDGRAPSSPSAASATGTGNQ